MQANGRAEHVLAKLRGLPPERIEEVEGFIDFLRSRDPDRALTQAAQAVTEPTLKCLWDNPEDAAYDA